VTSTRSRAGHTHAIRIVSATVLTLLALALSVSVSAQNPNPPPAQPKAASPANPSQGPQLSTIVNIGCTIFGTVIDKSGAAISGARVALTVEGQDAKETPTLDDGQFSFVNIRPGKFQISVTAQGFATQVAADTCATNGGIMTVPAITLAVATEITRVEVTVPRVEVAEGEIKVEEKQRVLGVVPNFYVTYIPDAAPLTSKQKFELAWKTTIDPMTFILTGAIAGVQQADNNFSGYGQGAQGYGKRYGAVYADTVTSTFIGGAILPSLFKQDPRYFYKGTGTVRSRALYAIANAVICKGDNKKWQPNYSGIIGSLAAGGISNLYYPDSDKTGAALTFENALIGIGTTAAANLLQEFVIKKLTPNAPKIVSNKPASQP
jgi:hypothetical protein